MVQKISGKQLIIFSGLFVLMGLLMLLVGMSIIEAPEESINAPLWVIRLCGFIFISAGIMIYLGEKNPYNHIFAAIIVFGMAAIGLWVSIFGDAKDFSGGLPLLGDETNVLLARLIFGSMAIMCIAIGIYALKKLFKKSYKNDRD